MQNASNVGRSLAEKRVAQLISRHGPDFICVFHFLRWSFQCRLYFLFLQKETLPAAQTKIYDSKKARHRRHFWTFGLSLKKHWSHQSESNLLFIVLTIVYLFYLLWFIVSLLFCVFIVLYVYYFLASAEIPGQPLNLRNVRGNKEKFKTLKKKSVLKKKIWHMILHVKTWKLKK